MARQNSPGLQAWGAAPREIRPERATDRRDRCARSSWTPVRTPFQAEPLPGTNLGVNTWAMVSNRFAAKSDRLLGYSVEPFHGLEPL
jgi:hypothetical protein